MEKIFYQIERNNDYLNNESLDEYEIYKHQLIKLDEKIKKDQKIVTYTNYLFKYIYVYENELLIKVTAYFENKDGK